MVTTTSALSPLFYTTVWKVIVGRLRMNMFLCATLGVSAITSLAITLTWLAALMHTPGKFPEHDPLQLAVSYFLGSYLGALTLTPVILALRDRVVGSRDVTTVTSIWRSALVRDVISWVVPTLAGLVWSAVSASDEYTRQLMRLALIWPVLGLTWRHGWHGTAVGGMMASFALASTANGPFDLEALKI